VLGGPGSDLIVAGSGDDRISGNAGDDRLDGSAGDDELFGGLGADSLHGGPGDDMASWADHREAVSVTLDGRNDDGARGEGDDAALDVENVTGGSGDNRLVGSAVANTLEGGEGVNDLSGGGGDDVLAARDSKGGSVSGGPGRDRLSVAPRSSLDVRDGDVDRVECDNGLARPPVADRVDKLAHCVPQVTIRGSAAHVRADGHVRLRIRCRAIAQRCRVRIRLRSQAGTLARASVRLRPRQASVVIPLNRLGRQVMRGRSALRVTAETQTFRSAPPPSTGVPESLPLTLKPS
jgi:hypothetical protein